MTLTIEQLPKDVDVALRKKAESEGRSVQEVAVEVLARGLGIPEEPSAGEKEGVVSKGDFSNFVGTMSPEDAKAIEDAVREQDEADLRLRREEDKRLRDLSKYRGKWIEDPAVDAALKSFDEVDEDLWK